MSQSTRIFGAYISALSIGGVSYLAVCQEFEVTWEYDTQEAVALNDVSHYPIGIRDKWTGTGKFFISTANTSGEGGPGGTLWTRALAKTQVAVSMKDNSVAGAGNTLSGNALITKCTQREDDNAVVVDISLTGQGELSSSIA